MSQSKYVAHIPAAADSIRLMSADEVRIIKQLVGKIGQSGIRYVEGSDAVVLTSNSLHDMLQIVDRNGWSHSRRPTQAAAGTTMYVLPSDAVIAAQGPLVFGVEYVAAAAPTRKDDARWVSELDDVVAV